MRSGGLAALLVALAAAAAREQLLHALEDEGRPIELQQHDADVGQRGKGEHGQRVRDEVAGGVELVQVALEAVAGQAWG